MSLYIDAIDCCLGFEEWLRSVFVVHFSGSSGANVAGITLTEAPLSTLNFTGFFATTISA